MQQVHRHDNHPGTKLNNYLLQVAAKARNAQFKVQTQLSTSQLQTRGLTCCVIGWQKCRSIQRCYAKCRKSAAFRSAKHTYISISGENHMIQAVEITTSLRLHKWCRKMPHSVVDLTRVPVFVHRWKHFNHIPNLKWVYTNWLISAVITIKEIWCHVFFEDKLKILHRDKIPKKRNTKIENFHEKHFFLKNY